MLIDNTGRMLLVEPLKHSLPQGGTGAAVSRANTIGVSPVKITEKCRKLCGAGVESRHRGLVVQWMIFDG
jgi:hypothetical protein